jgi:hypothetical protein
LPLQIVTIAVSVKVGEGLVMAADSTASFFTETSWTQSYYHARKVLQVKDGELEADRIQVLDEHVGTRHDYTNANAMLIETGLSDLVHDCLHALAPILPAPFDVMEWRPSTQTPRPKTRSRRATGARA